MWMLEGCTVSERKRTYAGGQGLAMAVALGILVSRLSIVYVSLHIVSDLDSLHNSAPWYGFVIAWGTVSKYCLFCALQLRTLNMSELVSRLTLSFPPLREVNRF